MRGCLHELIELEPGLMALPKLPAHETQFATGAIAFISVRSAKAQTGSSLNAALSAQIKTLGNLAYALTPGTPGPSSSTSTKADAARPPSAAGGDRPR